MVALLVVMLHAGEERGAPAVTTGDLLLQAAVMQRLEPVQLLHCCVTQPGPAGGRALTRDREPMVIVSSIQAPLHYRHSPAQLPHTDNSQWGSHFPHLY